MYLEMREAEACFNGVQRSAVRDCCADHGRLDDRLAKPMPVAAGPNADISANGSCLSEILELLLVYVIKTLQARWPSDRVRAS